MACPTPSMPQASAPASQNDRLERTSNIAGRKTKRSSPGLFLVDSRRGCPRHATRQIPFEIIQVPHGNHNAICKTGTRGLLAVVSHTTGNLRASPPLPVRVARASHEKEMDKIEGAPVAVLVVRGSMSFVDKELQIVCLSAGPLRSPWSSPYERPTELFLHRQCEQLPALT